MVKKNRGPNETKTGLLLETLETMGLNERMEEGNVYSITRVSSSETAGSWPEVGVWRRGKGIGERETVVSGIVRGLLVLEGEFSGKL